MRLLHAWMRNWYYVGGVIFAAMAILIALFADAIDPMRRIMMALFMCLLLHEFEEYAAPGGFPSAWNAGVSGAGENADRFPLNAKSAFIVNVCCVYPIYILGIVLSGVHFLSIVIAYMTMAQVLMHGIVMNRKMGTLYNPGVVTAAFVMVPVGIYALWFIGTSFDIPSWYWWAALATCPFIVALTIALPIRACQDENSPHVFPERDTRGFSIKGKVARLRR